MPRLDPAHAELGPAGEAVRAAPSAGGGGLGAVGLLLVVGVLAAGIGAAVLAQQRQDAETARRVSVSLEQVRQAQQAAFEQVRVAERQARSQADEMARSQRQASCELRAQVRCERECRQRPTACGECLPRERAACAAR